VNAGPELPTSLEYSTEVVTTLTHLYRGEMQRMSIWRQRLDITSNWAVIIATGLITFTLGSVEVPHYTLLLGLALALISILLEGRRYRHLHHSKWRLYLLESGFFADVLKPRGSRDVNPDWRRLLAADLRHTHFGLSWFTAMRLRLRRNYLFVIYFLAAAWVVKLFIHPGRPADFADFVSRLGVGHLMPPWFVAATALLFIATATVLGLSCPPAEVLEDWSVHYSKRRSESEDGD
jgi:uncharacterized membrane protein